MAKLLGKTIVVTDDDLERARRAAMLYSFLGTCNINEVNHLSDYETS